MGSVCSSELSCLCLWLAVLHAPSTKVWPPSAAKDHLLINPLPHSVFSLFTVWLNRVGPSPRVFTVYPHCAYMTVVLTKQMSVSKKNKKQFANSEKTNPTWEGELAISGM